MRNKKKKKNIVEIRTNLYDVYNELDILNIKHSKKKIFRFSYEFKFSYKRNTQFFIFLILIFTHYITIE